MVAGRNWRNLKPVGLVLALALVNVAFHIEDARAGLAEFSIRAALAVIVMLILLIGGRVIAELHRQLAGEGGDGPAAGSFRPAGRGVMALSAVALALWVAAPEGALTGALALPPARAISGDCRAGGASPRAATRWCSCCMRASSSPRADSSRPAPRPVAVADSLRGRRACVGDRRDRGDDAGDDDPGDPRAQRASARRLAGHAVSPIFASSLRSSLRLAMALLPDFALPLMDAAAGGVDARVRRISDRLCADADPPRWAGMRGERFWETTGWMTA